MSAEKPCWFCGAMPGLREHSECCPEKIHEAFLAGQEPLGAEFERIWAENVDKLYTK